MELLQNLIDLYESNEEMTVDEVLSSVKENVPEYAGLSKKESVELNRRFISYVYEVNCFLNPYLEAHHIVWLPKGGRDSIDNTAALCPNCHTKMHFLDDIEDVEKLKKVNSD